MNLSIEMPPSDVTLLIDGREFYCLKENLSNHSTYFESMFFSNFAEKDKKKIEVKGVSSDDFQLFLDAIQGVNSIFDGSVESALALAGFLGSPELEKKCMEHLAHGSYIPLKEQFQLAEIYNSENLMVQVCSSIKDAYELDKVVPKDLDSFCNTTKNIVLQRSFELLGIRKAPLPPQPEEPVLAFEDMMNEFLDQADQESRQGMILADQAALLKDHILYEEYLDRIVPEAKPLIQQDPRIYELMDELQNAHSPAERNAVRAQILVVKVKNIFTTLSAAIVPREQPWMDRALFILEKLYRIVHRNQLNHSKLQPSARGDEPIDRLYLGIIYIVDERLSTEINPPYDGIEPIWVAKIKEVFEELHPCQAGISQQICDQISAAFRGVSERARFQGLTRFVEIARRSLFMGWMRRNKDSQPRNQPEENMQDVV